MEKFFETTELQDVSWSDQYDELDSPKIDWNFIDWNFEILKTLWDGIKHYNYRMGLHEVLFR
jgi:hypothetical protein